MKKSQDYFRKIDELPQWRRVSHGKTFRRMWAPGGAALHPMDPPHPLERQARREFYRWYAGRAALVLAVAAWIGGIVAFVLWRLS